MFCPNCGTKNEETVTRCGQCGFDLKAQAVPAKFKGTVMMQAGAEGIGRPPATPARAPAAAAATPARASAASPLKGTMVGVAPPDLGQLAKATSAASSSVEPARAPAANPKLTKGTMVGVAPPSEAIPAQPAPATKIKGTMIGVAPPDVQAEIAAAKARIQSPQPVQAPDDTSPSAGFPQAPASPVVQQAAEHEPALAKGPPSKLKGTMIGVAPPDVHAEIAAAKARYLAGQADELPGDPTPLLGSTVGVGGAAADVNPLGGTVLGTSPIRAEELTPQPAPFRPSPLPVLPIGAPEDDDPPVLAGVPSRRSSTGPLFLLIALVVLAALAVAALLLRSGDEEKPATAAPAAAQ